MADSTDNSQVEPISYQNDLINAAIGKLRLTNEAVAEKATAILKSRGQSDPRGPMAAKTVKSIRNGDPNVRLTTLAAVVDALGLTLQEVFTPAPEERTEVAA